MTRNEFVLQAMLNMAGNAKLMSTNMHCVTSDSKAIAEAAKHLADAAETVAFFE